MILLSENNIIIIMFSLILVALAGLFYLLMQLTKRNADSKKLDEIYSRVKEDIKFAVTPKFMDLSISVKELIDLAVEVWRMEQRINKSASNLPENQLKGLENSVQKLRRYLEKYDIEIIDYKNIKYNDGLNLDILSVEKDPTITDPTVKETVEPTIMCKGQVVRKAKIILLSNN